MNYELINYDKTEPNKYRKSYAWKTAIGLQKVDNIDVSSYLIENAKRNIDGEISFQEVSNLINSYYEQKPIFNDRSEEADKVSIRIAELLSNDSFTFSPIEYINIHKFLFKDIYENAGMIRNYNILKAEWVLDGDTVIYGSYYNLKETLEYDFKLENEFSYKDLSINDFIKHIASFISNLWQIHIFGEGNTRTTAVFLIKYLRKFGFDINNDLFSNHSWYFRNALVRANYSNYIKGIYETTYYLELFLKNLLLNENNNLSNKKLHILYKPEETKKITINERIVLEEIKKNNHITIKELSIIINKSVRTVSNIIKELSINGYIKRVSGKKHGYWEILIDEF